MVWLQLTELPTSTGMCLQCTAYPQQPQHTVLAAVPGGGASTAIQSSLHAGQVVPVYSPFIVLQHSNSLYQLDTPEIRDGQH